MAVEWGNPGGLRGAARHLADEAAVLAAANQWRQPVAFAPVQVLGAKPGGPEAAIEIVVETGERVVVRPGASSEVLRTVLAVLRQC